MATRSLTDGPADVTSPAGGNRSRIAGFVLVALALAGPGSAGPDPNPIEPASTQTVRKLPAPGSDAWQPLLFRSIDEPTRYAVGRDPSGRPAYRATSACGASAMRLALPENFDLAKTPRLAWRWRIERGLDIADEQTKAGDDFAARVYVLFAFEPETAGVMARMERSLGRRLFGVDVPGRTLNYVWASRVEVGTSWTSPYHDDAKLLAVATDSAKAPDAGWRRTIVDLDADSKRLFAPPPESQPYAIALMVDADGSCDEAIAWFSDFELLGPDSRPK